MVSARRCHIPHRVITRLGDINWLPRSCDLTPFDFFFDTKDRVYADKPLTFKHLKTNIRQVMTEKNQCLQHFTWSSLK